MKPIVEYYKDQKGEHRWRLKARNGKIIADSGEGYTTPRKAREGFERNVKQSQEAEEKGTRGD